MSNKVGVTFKGTKVNEITENSNIELDANLRVMLIPEKGQFLTSIAKLFGLFENGIDLERILKYVQDNTDNKPVEDLDKRVDEMEDTVGDLDNLNTTQKGSLVDSINELVSTAGSLIDQLKQLTGTAYTLHVSNNTLELRKNGVVVSTQPLHNLIELSASDNNALEYHADGLYYSTGDIEEAFNQALEKLNVRVKENFDNINLHDDIFYQTVGKPNKSYVTTYHESARSPAV